MLRIGPGRVFAICLLESVVGDDAGFIRRKALRFSALRVLDEAQRNPGSVARTARLPQSHRSTPGVSYRSFNTCAMAVPIASYVPRRLGSGSGPVRERSCLIASFVS
jgi:hypothetical protein